MNPLQGSCVSELAATGLPAGDSWPARTGVQPGTE